MVHGFPSIFTIYNVSLKTGNQPSPSVQYGTWSHFLLWRSHGPTSSVSPPQDLSRFSGKVTVKRKSSREIGGNWVCNIQNPLFMRLSVSWACYELPASSGISVVVFMSVLTSGFIPYQGSPGHLKMHCQNLIEPWEITYKHRMCSETKWHSRTKPNYLAPHFRHEHNVNLRFTTKVGFLHVI